MSRPCGSRSMNTNGMSTINPTTPTCPAKETGTVHARRVRALPTTMLCSNIFGLLSPHPPF
jgi:hypothetical protein